MATSQAARIPQPDQPDLNALKTRQHAAWSSGDYAIVGTTLQIVGEQLCETLDIRAGQKVLDVAAGNGNATLAAARAGAMWSQRIMSRACSSAAARAPRRTACR
jgi:2-polyprenyl-3-methyl-5-hydroxy-6-metoxy-1,4-benzoquinol methylase